MGVVVALGALAWAAVAAFVGPSRGSGPSATIGPRGSDGSPRMGSASPSVAPSPPPSPAPPECVYDDILAPKSRYRDWRITLLDTRLRLLDSYEPRDLVSVSEAGFPGDFLVRRRLIRDLAALREAAERAGNPVEIIAAYRSFDQQAVLFERRVEEFGEDVALTKVARPGHSEHQLGTAVDFKRPGAPDVSERFGRSRPGRWLRRNAHRFGFVLTYPQGMEELTCYAYEPWHYRYFGPELAEEIRASGLTAREFLWALHQSEREP